MDETTRSLLKQVYKITMIVVTVVVAGAAIFAFANATPGNGLDLVGGILVVFALIAGLSISKLEWRDKEAENYTPLGRLRDSINLSTSVSFAEPEVHRVDTAMLDTAKRMASEGAPIDDICRTIDPDHDSHIPVHQEAFRKIVQAMVAQS